MSTPWTRIVDQFNHVVWIEDPDRLAGLRRVAIKTVRLIYAVTREGVGGQLNLRAMSLVYTTLLSIVPLLAVTFSVLKGFKVHDRILPMLENFLAPLGEQGAEMAQTIVAFVENVQVGLLGGVGLGLLIYTAVSLVQKIESSFNHVWHVRHLRGFAQRFSNYLSIVLVGPLFTFAVLGLTASLMNTGFARRLTDVEPFGSLMFFAAKLTPYLLVWAVFTFLYATVPNIRVRFGPAAIAGLVAGVMWQSSGWFFASFIASSSRYTAIYSSFAIMILALIWVYMTWLILLLGTQISFFLQNPHFVTMQPLELALSNRMKERLGVSVMALIGYNHVHDIRPWTLEGLIDRMALPTEAVSDLLDLLKSQGYLETTDHDPPRYLPARDVATIPIAELLGSIRRADENRFLNNSRGFVPDSIGRVLDAAGVAARASLEGITVRDLVTEKPAPEGAANVAVEERN